MKDDIQADLDAVKKRLAELKEQVEEPQTITEWIWVGLGVGAILGLIINIFIVWGGSPRGMFWRIDDIKEEITLLCDDHLQHRHDGMYGSVRRKYEE